MSQNMCIHILGYSSGLIFIFTSLSLERNDWAKIRGKLNGLKAVAITIFQVAFIRYTQQPPN